LTHGFKDLSALVVGFVSLGPVGKAVYMVEAHGGRSCLPHGGWEAKKEIERAWCPNIPFKVIPL
jgi:hypothetical protein